jgi:hypothetical protein
MTNGLPWPLAQVFVLVEKAPAPPARAPRARAIAWLLHLAAQLVD